MENHFSLTKQEKLELEFLIASRFQIHSEPFKEAETSSFELVAEENTSKSAETRYVVDDGRNIDLYRWLKSNAEDLERTRPS